jgi:hypothetical protein
VLLRPTTRAVLLCALALALPTTAGASLILGDRDVSAPALAVNENGVALVSYRSPAGLVRHVLVRGAVNGVANPALAARQRAFQVDYSGGAGSWRAFRDACRRYDGPRLPFFVAGCTAPDGSYWALQRWQRNLPVRGIAPWTAAQRAVELHVSHWSGPLPVLEIDRHWTYSRTHQGFFGRLTYLGNPVFGTRTASARVVDPFARNISIDTFDSSFGSGWRHDTAIATHTGNGGFCYSFVPQPLPPGYPETGSRGDGLGTQFRVSVIGPGVLPIVQWVGPTLTGFDPTAQAAATRRFDELLGTDRHCVPER